MINIKKIIITNKYIELSLFLLLFFILEFEYFDFVNIPLFREKMGFDFSFSIWKFGLAKVFIAGLLFLNYKLKGFNYFVNSLSLIFLSPKKYILEILAFSPLSIE